MSYNATEPTPVDVIRGLAGDTSNDDASEAMADETYVAILGRFGVGATAGTDITTAAFYRAAAESLRRVAIAIEAKPTSISAPQDGSIGWASRTQSLRDHAKALDAKADEIESANTGGLFGAPITIRKRFLTGNVNGGDSW